MSLAGGRKERPGASGRKERSGIVAAVALGLALALPAAPALAAGLKVSDAWLRATAPGQQTASAGLTIRSEKAAKLVAARTPVAKRVELHIMKQEKGMMIMRQVPSIALPAGQAVELGTTSHLMLVGLKHQLKAGEKVELTLTVRVGHHKERVKVSAKVIPLTADAPGSDDKGDGMGSMDMGGGSKGGSGY